MTIITITIKQKVHMEPYVYENFKTSNIYNGVTHYNVMDLDNASIIVEECTQSCTCYSQVKLFTSIQNENSIKIKKYMHIRNIVNKTNEISDSDIQKAFINIKKIINDNDAFNLIPIITNFESGTGDAKNTYSANIHVHSMFCESFHITSKKKQDLTWFDKPTNIEEFPHVLSINKIQTDKLTGDSYKYIKINNGYQRITN